MLPIRLSIIKKANGRLAVTVGGGALFTNMAPEKGIKCFFLFEIIFYKHLPAAAVATVPSSSTSISAF